MCCLRLHGGGPMLFYSNAQKTKSHIRAVLEVLTDNHWSNESANVTDRGVSAHTPIHPIFQLPEFIFKSFIGYLIKKTGIIGDYERRKCCDVIRECDATIKIFECTHDCLYD